MSTQPPRAWSARAASRLALVALAVLSAGTLPIRVAAEDAANFQRPALALVRTVYRRTSDETFRRWLRASVVTAEDEARYGLKLDKNVPAAPPELPLVVLIHGFNSTPARNAAIMEPIRAAGFPTAVFVYPNDSDIADSAARLSSAHPHAGQRTSRSPRGAGNPLDGRPGRPGLPGKPSLGPGQCHAIGDDRSAVAGLHDRPRRHRRRPVGALAPPQRRRLRRPAP